MVAFSRVPYEKGFAFLYYLQVRVGCCVMHRYYDNSIEMTGEFPSAGWHV